MIEFTIVNHSTTRDGMPYSTFEVYDGSRRYRCNRIGAYNLTTKSWDYVRYGEKKTCDKALAFATKEKFWGKDFYK